jgi:hypothetical protein
MIYTYFDATLAKRINDDYESRAIADVNSLGFTNTVATAYLYQQLVIYRCYQIMALELSTANDDIYAQKLTHYRKEYDAVSKQFKNALLTAATVQPSASSRKSISFGRG